MPVEHAYTIRAGSTHRMVLAFMRGGDGEGIRGLRADAADAAASFIRLGEPAAHRFPLVPATPGEYRPGGFTELDPEVAPGIYQLGLPDAVLAEGSEEVLILLRFPEAVVDPIVIHLVAFDPQDAVCLGMTGLANKNRHEFLRRALPRLTEMELELGRRQEEALRARPNR